MAQVKMHGYLGGKVSIPDNNNKGRGPHITRRKVSIQTTMTQVSEREDTDR